MDVGCFGCSIRPCHITHSTQRTHSKRVYNSRRPPSFLHLTPSFSPLSLFTTHLTYSLHDFSTTLHTTTHSTQSLHDTTTSRRRNLSTANLAHQINQPFTQQKCSSPSLPPPPSWPSLVSSLSFLLVSLLVLSSTLPVDSIPSAGLMNDDADGVIKSVWSCEGKISQSERHPFYTFLSRQGRPV